ncbi:hypothetical protein ACP4OV_022945 [Aristida adscensionis]
MATAAARCTAAAAPAERPALPVPDELLEEIFVRLDAAADLARASAACASFRRVVSARRFLRRFRSLHPPPLLGHLDFERDRGAFHPAEPPHRSAPAARALARAADFAFSFLPDPESWSTCDVRDGRVLLYRQLDIFRPVELVVCDPLHRRYVQIPPIPDDLAASAWCVVREYNTFLDAACKEAKDEQEEDLSFRLICYVHSHHKLVTFNFASATGRWHGVTFDRSTPLHPLVPVLPALFQRHYAHGCFYITHRDILSLFTLDGREMKFSFMDHHPPIRHGQKELAIVEAGEGRLGLLTCGYGVLDLYSATLPNNGANTVEWRHEKIIPLPDPDCSWYIPGAEESHILLIANPLSDRKYTHQWHYFTLDLKTLLIERLCVSDRYIVHAGLYKSFPPLLSLPSV